jgi:hypothetical protein
MIDKPAKSKSATRIVKNQFAGIGLGRDASLRRAST